MAKLVYSMLMSFDGYTADSDGKFDWAHPDEEVHAFANDLERNVGTSLYGRRMYETMSVWESAEMRDSQHPVIAEFSKLWSATTKVVYSTTLDAVTTTNTRIERSFDVDGVRAIKATAEKNVSISGPGLAAHAIRAGLVDEYHFLVFPIVVGGGTKALPDGVRFDCELVSEHRFASGVVHLHYRTMR